MSPAHLAGRTISRVMIIDDNPEIHRCQDAGLGGLNVLQVIRAQNLNMAVVLTAAMN